MAEVMDALLLARRALCAQVARLDVRVRMLAQTIAPCRRLMTVPGIGPITEPMPIRRTTRSQSLDAPSPYDDHQRDQRGQVKPERQQRHGTDA